MVNVPVIIEKDYQVQANPAGNEFLVPLQLQLEHADGITCGIPVYPPGCPYRLEGTDEDLMTYADSISVKVAIKAIASASNGERLVKGILSYQACDARNCFFPAAVPVEIKVAVSY
jgi:hypothetical protein